MDTVEFELTRDDLRQAMEAHYRSRSGSWVIRVVSLVLLAMGSLALVGRDYAAGTALFAAGMLYPVVSTRIAALAVLRRKRLPEGRVRLTFRDHCIEVEGPEFSGELRQLERVAVAPRSLLLYVDHVHYLVVPRRVFTQSGQFQEVTRRARRLLEDDELPAADE